MENAKKYRLGFLLLFILLSNIFLVKNVQAASVQGQVISGFNIMGSYDKDLTYTIGYWFDGTPRYTTSYPDPEGPPVYTYNNTKPISNITYMYSTDGVSIQTGSSIPTRAKWVTISSFNIMGSYDKDSTYATGYWFDGTPRYTTSYPDPEGYPVYTYNNTKPISNVTYKYSTDGVSVQTGSTVPANAKWVTISSFNIMGSYDKDSTYATGYWFDGTPRYTTSYPDPEGYPVYTYNNTKPISNITYKYSTDGVSVQTGSTVPANAKWVTISSFNIMGSYDKDSTYATGYWFDGTPRYTTSYPDPEGYPVYTYNNTKPISNVAYQTFAVNSDPIINLNTADNQTLTELDGNNVLSITGTAKDIDIGDLVKVKYSIDSLSSHTNVIAASQTANGSDQSYNFNIPISNTIPEGTHIIKVWAEDNYWGKSQELTRTFFVDKSVVASNGQPILRVISTAGKAYDMSTATGSYTDVTDDFIQNAFGNGKPFYLRSYTYKFNGFPNTFYDNGFTATYIDDNKLRVVTSEGKAFDVDRETWTYTEVTNSFLKDNFGPGKPFYHRVYEQEVNNSGPFAFRDFGSTMAYIGNNKIRIVTAEGKAFDVDKDTGAYTDITATFLVNNFGSGKPFFLRTYTYTIGGEAKTFYDWGSSMTYIGNNILRVVTSEGKAFDVDKDTGVYTDITSTFLINNFGEGKPFYLRTYPVTINGTSYDFYDWGCTFAYTDTDCPDITITTPREQAAFETITLSGTVSDKNGGAITVSAAIAGVTKTATITNTTTPQDWSLEWHVAADNIPDGSYTDIVVQAENEAEEFSAATYTGTIAIYGAGSGLTRKTAHYEYDANGKLVSRYTIEN